MRGRREILAVAVAAAAALAAQVLAFRSVRLDDAYITFRYSQNLANGAGLVFNPGERILGTTAPAHALAGALLHVFAGHDALPTAMAVLGCIGWTAQAFLVREILLASFGQWAAALAAFGVAAGIARSHLFVPLETNMVAAIGLAAVVLASRGRWTFAAVAVAVATLFRPDAVLLAVPLGVVCVRKLGVGALKRAAVGAGVLLPWVAFATLYYGSPIPRTLSAKMARASSAAYFLHLTRDVAAMTLPFSPRWFIVAVTWAAVGWGVRCAIVRRALFPCVLFAWGALHALVYMALRPDVAFTWHIYSSVLAFSVALLVAVADGLARLDRRIAIPVGAVVIGCIPMNAIKFARTHAHVFWYGSRDGVYSEAASWLREHATPDDVVEAEEVGTMAYWSGLRFRDHAGLIGEPFDHAVLARPGPPMVRFSVMTQIAEVRAHLQFFGRVPPMAELKYDRWHIWIADLRTNSPPSLTP